MTKQKKLDKEKNEETLGDGLTLEKLRELEKSNKLITLKARDLRGAWQVDSPQYWTVEGDNDTLCGEAKHLNHVWW